MKLPQKRLHRALVYAAAFVLPVLALPVQVPIGDDNHVPDGRSASSEVAVHQRSEAVQHFIAGGKSIHFVEVDVARPPKVKRGALHLSIARVSGSRLEPLATLALPTKFLRRNTLHRYRFRRPDPVHPGETLALVFRSDAAPDDPVFLRINPAFSLPNAPLTVAQKGVAGSLEVSVEYWRPRRSLVRAIPKVWSRLTLFLGPTEKTLFVLGLILAFGGVLALMMRPTERPYR